MRASFVILFGTVRPEKANHSTNRVRPDLLTTVVRQWQRPTARRFLLPGRAKALWVVYHYEPCLSIQKGYPMQENSMRPYGDTLIPVIPIEQEADIRHGQDHPFCFADPTCPCHEDPTLIAVVAEQVA